MWAQRLPASVAADPRLPGAPRNPAADLRTWWPARGHSSDLRDRPTRRDESEAADGENLRPHFGCIHATPAEEAAVRIDLPAGGEIAEKSFRDVDLQGPVGEVTGLPCPQIVKGAHSFFHEREVSLQRAAQGTDRTQVCEARGLAVAAAQGSQLRGALC